MCPTFSFFWFQENQQQKTWTYLKKIQPPYSKEVWLEKYASDYLKKITEKPDK